MSDSRLNVYKKGEDIALQLAAALGLPDHFRRLELVFEVGVLPLVKVEFYPDSLPDASTVVPALAAFRLVPMVEGERPADEVSHVG